VRNLLRLFLVFAVVFTVSVQVTQAKEPQKNSADLAADFKLRDLNQKTFSLSSYRGKQPVLLLFWTTWCPFCQMEIKNLKNMYPQLVKEGWELFAIDVGESSRKVENAVKSLALNFKVLLDEDGSTSNSYEIIGVPTYVIIDSKGRIVFKDHYFPKEKYKKLASE
jgi:peroxiredoxin